MFDCLDKNYKGSLLEIAASYFAASRPSYFHFEYGPAHAKVYRCICIFQRQITPGEGRTKVEAEQSASQIMLEQLKERFFELKDSRWLFTSKDYGCSLTDESKRVVGDLKSDPNFDAWSLYGDAIIRYYIARYLFDKYSHFSEGILTRIITEACRIETRAMIAADYCLEKYVRTEVTERTLSETLSAVIGKLALLISVDHATSLIKEFYKAFVDKIAVSLTAEKILDSPFSLMTAITTTVHNFKGKLFEYAQEYGLTPPTFSPISKTGPDHNPQFEVKSKFNGYSAIGKGKNLKSAEQDAARQILELVHVIDAKTTRVVKSSYSYSHQILKIKSFKPLELDELKLIVDWFYFENLAHLSSAFTHPSQNSVLNYQRLEFLGDAILKKILLTYFLKTHPTLQDKARLSKITDILVSADTQFLVAERLNLKNFIYSSSPITPSILGDVLEALIAVIYLEAETCTNRLEAERVIASWFLPDIKATLESQLSYDISLVSEKIITVSAAPDKPTRSLYKPKDVRPSYVTAAAHATSKDTATADLHTKHLVSRDSSNYEIDEFPALSTAALPQRPLKLATSRPSYATAAAHAASKDTATADLHTKHLVSRDSSNYKKDEFPALSTTALPQRPLKLATSRPSYAEAVSATIFTDKGTTSYLSMKYKHEIQHDDEKMPIEDPWSALIKKV